MITGSNFIFVGYKPDLAWPLRPRVRFGVSFTVLKRSKISCASSIVALLILQGCAEGVVIEGLDGESESDMMSALDTELTEVIRVRSGGEGNQWLILPDSDDFGAIPQDPANPINETKVALGKMLFHDTGIATNGQSGQSHTWSCATCHHAAAGFKSGVPQGIGEGGTGFGPAGKERRLAADFDANAAKDATNKPDLQPLTSPSILNTAYQDVMLWNGQFGNRVGGLINAGIDNAILAKPETPKKENARALSGLEIQAIAGLEVHRLDVRNDAVMQTMPAYAEMFGALGVTPSADMRSEAGKAIAAYERTVVANRAPFQDWLKGDTDALSDAEKRGAILFFGKADCADCHRGPALSSELDASEDEVFMAVGFDDFNSASQALVHGPVTDADKKGRGGFTEQEADNYKFKIPQLYNLADTDVFGHGASFSSIRDVLEYKNKAIAQSAASMVNLDARFKPLNLSNEELDDLTAFLTTALYDAELARYQPKSVPSGECIVVDPQTVETHGMCP